MARSAKRKLTPVPFSRVFVFAYSVSREMRELCSSYGIECFSVDQDLVRSWSGHRGSASPGN